MGHGGSTPGFGQNLSISSVVNRVLLNIPYYQCDEGQTVSSDAFMATDAVMKTAETDITVASVSRLDSMESHGQTRSLSSSSSSSFDSCSDLLGSLDLQKGVLQQDTESYKERNYAEEEREYSNLCLARREVQNSVKEHSEGLSIPVDVDGCEVSSDQLLERSALLQSSILAAPHCKSSLSSLESVSPVTCSKVIGKYPSDPAMVTSGLRNTLSLNLRLHDKSEEHLNKGMEASKDNFSSALDNEEDVVSDINPFQQTKGDGSAAFLPSRDWNAEDTYSKDVADWHIQRFLNSEMEDSKTYEATNIEDGASLSVNFPSGLSKPATDSTDIIAEDTHGASQLFVNKEQGERSVYMEAHNDPVLKVLDPLKLQSSENSLLGGEVSEIQEHSDFHSIFSNPENGMKGGVKDQHGSSSNVAFGKADLGELIHETVMEKTFDINTGTLGNKTGLGGLVEGANYVTQDHSHTHNSQERMFDTSDSDDDLQQLEDTIKFFDLHRSNSFVSHPLHSLSSGSGRPDLEEVDKQFDSSQLVGRDQSCPLPLSEEHHVSSGSYPNIDSTCLDGLMQVPGMKGTEALDSNSYRHDRISKIPFGDWNERVFANSLDRKEGRHWPLLEKEMFGKVPMKCVFEGASHQKNMNTVGWEEEDLGPDELSRYVETLDVNETYIDTVLDMEDVLLNSDESSRGRFLQTTSGMMIATPRPSRDGSLSSSTSGTQIFSSDYTSSARDIPFTIDWVEVVGARQRKGGSSLGERMVGVKDHTVYCIKVVSGKEAWEVSRRYRDFVDLYHQLKRIFNTHAEKSLPSPWEEVEYESRKVFGSTSPNAIEVRSYRIERCLQSLVQAGPPFNTASPLFWFLWPKVIDGGCWFENHLSKQASSVQHGSNVQLGALDSPQLQSPRSDTGSSRTDLEQDISSFILGKTIKLVLKIHPNKSLKQLLYSQHYSCAGCYKHLDLEKGVMQGLVQTFGWRKPRFCEYSGQLFCASCHLNETAVLPAHVLRHWDFTARRVCQLAKAYLDSIYDQPMLCVSAVNPYLYSRVPILTHIKETRRKLSRMISCVHCPSRARIQQTLGSRRYLLESNDFFALRDLEDLSKGAFAVLPGLLTAVMENLKVHITKQCSVCQDTGEWCGAGILCEDPFSPIFPFQDDNVIHCKICHAPFHKNCFMKCQICPSCTKDWSNEAVHAANGLDSHKCEGLTDYGEMTACSDSRSITRNASSSSLAVAESQGSSTELEGKTQRNWPFNNLFRRRLW